MICAGAVGHWPCTVTKAKPPAFGVFHPMAVAIVHGLIGCAGDDALFHISVALLTVLCNLVGRIRGYFNTTFVRIIIIGAVPVWTGAAIGITIIGAIVARIISRVVVGVTVRRICSQSHDHRNLNILVILSLHLHDNLGSLANHVFRTAFQTKYQIHAIHCRTI